VRRRLGAALPPPRRALPPAPPAPVEPAPPPKVPLNETQSVIAEIAAKHGLSYAEVADQTRKTKVVNARHEAMWVLRTQHKRSFQFIGRFFKLDHTTVLHGVRRWERMRGEGNG